MKPEEIDAAARKILGGLKADELEYVRSESKRRSEALEDASTPFSCLHDLMDANELLPEISIDWDSPDGPDFTYSNAIMEAFNKLVQQQN